MRGKASLLHPRVNGGLADRAPTTQANPIGSTSHITRETAPMHPRAPARIMHPKLNRMPWSTSYRVVRPTMSPRKAGRVRKG